MVLAQKSGIAAAQTDHFDLSPGTKGQPPLFPRKGGGLIRAPDLVLMNVPLGLVIGVEVETRTVMTHYPGATVVEVAKLRDDIEIDLVAVHYARTEIGEDLDQAASWRQRDVQELLAELDCGTIGFVLSRDGTKLALLYPFDLEPIDKLFQRVRDGK